ncbi:MAG TPA: hypothetical protein DC006_03110 [Prevotellaceae bacterium]|nr:hypothetical protein [Prevotellaceae bacterium]
MKTEAIYIGKKNVQQRTLRQMVLESKAITAVANLYSAILGEEVSALKAVKLTNAQVATASLMIFGGMSPLVAALLLAWMALAVYQCRD